MNKPKYGVCEYGYTSIAIYDDYKIALEICDSLNTKKKGKKIYYINKYKVITIDKRGGYYE